MEQWMNKIYLTLIVVSLYGCSKKTLDFSNSIYSVKEVINSKIVMQSVVKSQNVKVK